jgi:glycosyltransferase involved in cell wall biosynthesis
VSKPKILFVLNILHPGTGPFQRAIRFDDDRAETTILSCYDTTEQLTAKVAALGSTVAGKRLVGLGERGKLRCARALCRFIKQHRPDVIQVNHTFSAVVATAFAAIRRSCPSVRFEGTMFERYGWAKRLGLGMAYAPNSGVIAVSHAINEGNPLWGGALERRSARRVIYNGVDIAELDRYRHTGDRSAWGIPEDAFVIGSVSDLKPTKDLPTLLAAVSRMSSPKDWRLLLVGGGPLEADLRAQATELGIADRVVFAGQVERREVYRLLDVMDVFAFPTLVEGLSEALVQAMCFEVTPVVSDIAPNLEVVSPGEHGLVFPARDVDALSDCLTRLSDDLRLRSRLGLAARQRVDESFDIYRIVEQYHEFYEEIIDRRAA